MKGSKICTLYKNDNKEHQECPYDNGGYFIVNGSEKVIIPQDRICENKPLIFIKKDVQDIYSV